MLYYFGCVMYADDLTLFASSLCELQRMIDICVDEATNLCMQFYSKKCSVIRFGPRYHSQCADVFRQITWCSALCLQKISYRHGLHEVKV